MRALVLRDYYDIAVEDRPDPVPGSGQAVVEVIATGICGSDFHGYPGEKGRRHPGQIMGHETVGRVRELGSDVAELKVGQLVTVNPVMSCHACPACLSGQEHWCTRRVGLGVAPDEQHLSEFVDPSADALVFTAPAGGPLFRSWGRAVLRPTVLRPDWTTSPSMDFGTALSRSWWPRAVTYARSPSGWAQQRRVHADEIRRIVRGQRRCPSHIGQPSAS